MMHTRYEMSVKTLASPGGEAVERSETDEVENKYVQLVLGKRIARR